MAGLLVNGWARAADGVRSVSFAMFGGLVGVSVLALLVGTCGRVAQATVGNIITVAGTGTGSYNGDNQPAIDAEVNFPFGVAVDGAGDVYVADCFNNRVRKIDSSGTITTIAGTGFGGYNGDNQPAVDAELDNPDGIAIDGKGDIYIADANNNRIREINTSGTITTIAGTGVLGGSGDGGPAVDAELHGPAGLALAASGDLYFADAGNNRVREVTTTGTIVTVAGTGLAGYNGDSQPAVDAELQLPSGVALDNSGNLYIADTANDRIRKVDPSGTISTLTAVQLPAGLGVDANGNVYIADTHADDIELDASGTITTIAGTGVAGYNGDNQAATSAQLSNPNAVAVDTAGNVFISDADNNRIREITESAGAELPEAPFVIALPLLAIMLMGFAWALHSRRRRHVSTA